MHSRRLAWWFWSSGELSRQELSWYNGWEARVRVRRAGANAELLMIRNITNRKLFLPEVIFS
jgi:hypothetical protein